MFTPIRLLTTHRAPASLDEAAIINSGRLDLAPLVQARFPLTRIHEAFEAAAGRQAMKVVVEPGS